MATRASQILWDAQGTSNRKSWARWERRDTHHIVRDHLLESRPYQQAVLCIGVVLGQQLHATVAGRLCVAPAAQPGLRQCLCWLPSRAKPHRDTRCRMSVCASAWLAGGDPIVRTCPDCRVFPCAEKRGRAHYGAFATERQADGEAKPQGLKYRAASSMADRHNLRQHGRPSFAFRGARAC